MSNVTVQTIDAMPPYEGPHAIPGIRFRAARAELGVTSWGMNVLDLDPGCSGHPTHDHAHDGQEEVYVVLSGQVTLVCDGVERTLDAGQMARVGPEVTRQLVTREQAARVLAVGAVPGAAFVPQM